MYGPEPIDYWSELKQEMAGWAYRLDCPIHNPPYQLHAAQRCECPEDDAVPDELFGQVLEYVDKAVVISNAQLLEEVIIEVGGGELLAGQLSQAIFEWFAVKED